MTPRPDIAALIHEGLSNTTIARRLHVATKTVRATRECLGLPPSRHGYSQGLTLEETWRARARAVDGGHLEWTGQRNSHGVPVLKHGGRRLSAYRIAFRIRAGRDPEGVVWPACGMPGCVAPDHLDDNAIRQRDRQAMRAVLGMGPRPERCPEGHDQAAHGRLKGDSRHYCAACDRAYAADRRGDAA